MSALETQTTLTMKSKSKNVFTGINIQFPISRLILDGSKTIETRTYPIPEKYIGVPLALVETPGSTASFKSRVIGIIIFERSFRYENKSCFYEDSKRHRVTAESPWAWDSKKGKWGWPVRVIKTLKEPIPIKKKKGIIYTTGIQIPKN